MNEPVAPPPVRPPSKPSRPPERRAAEAEPSAVAVRGDTQPEPLLANMLASSPADGGSGSAEAPRTTYGAFMGLRRNVDPDRDLAPTAPRLPRYVVAAITLIRNATGRSQQQVIAEALTGAVPLPAEALDAAFFEIYGYPREDHLRRQ